MSITEKITAAAEFIRSQTHLRPKIGLVLGSSLGGYAEVIETADRVHHLFQKLIDLIPDCMEK